jgi:cysteine synthase B
MHISDSASTLLDHVGNTPLLHLTRTGSLPKGVQLYAKAEFLNPSGSVKDRAARAMLLDAIESSRLVEGKTIVDATSGNTGIAYATWGRVLGFPVELFLPSNTSPERKQILKALGSILQETDALEGSDGAYLAAKAAAKANPEKYFYPDQYNNPANARAHFLGTGREIWEQTKGRVTHFITGLGTSGTFTGVARRLKKENPAIRTIAQQPASPLHGIEGTKHLGTTIKPGILDEQYIDEIVTVTTEEAYEATRRLASDEGLFVGVSSGANISAALKLAATVPAGSLIVTVLCDSGTRYLSDPFWDEGSETEKKGASS